MERIGKVLLDLAVVIFLDRFFTKPIYLFGGFGILAFLASVLSGSYMVHFYRNVFSHVPSTKVREVSHMLKAIHAQESRRAAREKADAVIAELKRQRMTKAAELVAESIDETLTFYAFPDSHWIKIRTNR